MGSYNCGAIRGKGGRITGYQPSTRVSKKPCLKGIKWKVIAQDPHPASSCAPSLCAYVLKDERWAISKSTPVGSS